MTKLYTYQKKAVLQIQKFKGRALLADEMGLGKTLEVLWWVKRSPKKRPVVVVCPASLKWVWEAEAMKHIKVRATILNGRTPPKKKKITKRRELYIINYRILKYWVSYLRRLRPQVLIIDECHYQKSRGADCTQAIERLVKGRKSKGKIPFRIPHIIAISGTPLTNRPEELFTTLRLIQPKTWNSHFFFVHRYCKPELRPWGWEYKGANNIKELHRKLKRTMMIRNLKKDVLKDLPEKTRSVIPLEIRNRKEYQEAENNFITWLTKKSTSKAEKAKRAKKLVQLGYLKRLAAELKMNQVLEWIDNFLEQSEGKLVIYGIHKKIIKRLHKKYKKISVIVDGSVSNKKRKIAVRSFQQNKKFRLFIGNIKAAGVGITLTAAHNLVFVELDWVPGNMVQAEDRIHRIGQKNAAMIYYLVARNTIEEKLCKIIQKKQRVLSQVLDGSIKTNRLDVYRALEKSLLKGK